MLRAILCLCVLFLLSAERAEAGVVNCPTTLKLNPNWTQGAALGPSYATATVGNDLVCQFAPISFDSFLSFHPFGCPAKSANAATSGGSGTWNFGSPGSSKVVNFNGHGTLIWGRSPHGIFFPDRGCAYDEATPPVVAVWAGRSQEYDLYRQRLQPQPIQLRAAALSADFGGKQLPDGGI
jgi:hypothetical protein